MKEPNVSVAIMHGREIEFTLYGDFIHDKNKQTFNGKMNAILTDNKISLKYGGSLSNPFQEILLRPIDPITESFLIKNVTIGLDFHWEQKQNQRFSGSIKLIIENGTICVINIIPVEHYLTSVISSEMSATSSIELLKAHAIISRSWLLAQMDKRNSANKSVNAEQFTINKDENIKWYDQEDHILYDVCADDHCQRYQGITRNHAHNAEKAVKETKGFILLYNNKICDARYSKACGGKTEIFENVWENINHPYLQSFVDYKYEPDGYNMDLVNEKHATKWILNSPISFCNTNDPKILDQVLNYYDRKTSDFYRWRIQYTQTELSAIIKKKTGTDFGKIIDLIPVERGLSGRLIRLKIVGSNKTLIIGKELEIRKTLSESHLYSSAFVVNKGEYVDNVPQIFELIGAGWGHGVGLCQIGAAVMGEKGYKFDEILLHYFRGAKIQKIY